MKKDWQKVLAVMVAIFILSVIINNLFSNWYVVHTNEEGFSMGVWLGNIGVPMKSKSPKKYQIYQYIVVSNTKLEGFSEKDGSWETCSPSTGECTFYLFTNTNPSGKI